MPDVSQKTFESIKKEAIKPTPAWVFGLKEDAIWAIVFISLSLMIISFSIIFGIFYETDWQLISSADLNLYQYFLRIVPTIWLILFILSSIIFYEGLRHTKNGYKTENRFLLISSSFLLLIMAIILETPGYNLILDKISSNHLPYYNGFENALISEINRPDDGIVVGKISSLNNNDFDLIDFSGKTWHVQATSQELNPFIHSCHLVVVYGEINNDQIFVKNLKPLYKNKYLNEYHPGCN